MTQTYALVTILFATRLINCDRIDPIYFNPYEYGNIPAASYYPTINYPSQQILHLNPKPRFAAAPDRPNDHDFMFNEVSDALKDIHLKEEETGQSRAVVRDPAPYLRQDETGQSRAVARDPAPYTQFGYGTNYGPQIYHSTSTPATPTTTMQPTKIPLLKPDFSGLLQPVTTKISNKFNGLVGLIFSVLTGSPLQGDFGGIKDIIVDGILRPLLTAKSGIKSLISKLSIPLVSLLLINLEVLVTVWWLWEECPAPPAPVMPSPDPKPAYHDVSYS